MAKFIIEGTTFLGWWNALSIKAQQAYIKSHDPKDSNYKIALANQKGNRKEFNAKLEKALRAKVSKKFQKKLVFEHLT